MLTVEEYGRIRRAHLDGMGIREIARQFGYSRNKVREVLRGSGEPKSYGRRRKQSFSKVGPVKDVILAILKSDESEPRKQRHTAQRLFERLRDEYQYTGGYDAVRKFIKRHRANQRETYIPLDHSCGRRMEADFGKIYVDFPEGRKQVSILIMVWSVSNAPFAIALPTERTEAILFGMQKAFEFFGVVPREVWWDNPRTVAEELLVGRDRRLQSRYAAFASHYVFEPLFCMPARGNEKPIVENRVKTLQRRWGTPVPSKRSMEDLNEYLRECCIRDRSRAATAAGVGVLKGNVQPSESADLRQSEMTAETAAAPPELGPSGITIGDVLKQELQSAASLPHYPFEPCLLKTASVDKYQMVHFDKVRYSVPRDVAFRTVTVKGFINEVRIIFEDRIVASHKRCYEPHREILEPQHYLNTLTQRPAALDHSGVMRDWKLPECFAELRSRLEQHYGHRAGIRHYVRVLQLLSQHSVSQVATEIEKMRVNQEIDPDRLIRRVESRIASSDSSAPEDHPGLSRSDVSNLQVPSLGLTHFDALLNSDSQDQPALSLGDAYDCSTHNAPRLS